MKIGEPIVFDDPDNRCFGCSPSNPRGLQLDFTCVGERAVEVRFCAEPNLCGATGILHGGIQATLLDEVLGAACHMAFRDEQVNFVTAEFSLRYRRPATVETVLVVRGEVLRVEGRDIWARGAIRDEVGEKLTTAEARWCRIG